MHNISDEITQKGGMNISVVLGDVRDEHSTYCIYQNSTITFTVKKILRIHLFILNEWIREENPWSDFLKSQSPYPENEDE